MKAKWLKWLIYTVVLLFLWVRRSVVYRLLSVGTVSLLFVFALLPLYRRFRQKGISASASALLSVLVFLLVFLLAVCVLVPLIAVKAYELFKALLPILDNMMNTLPELISASDAEPNLWGKAYDLLGKALPGISTALAKGGVSAAEQTGNAVLALVIAYYFLSEWETYFRVALLCVPYDKRSAVLAGISACRIALLGYLISLAKTALFVAAASFVGLSLIGVDHALPLSILMGALEALPYVGPLLAAIPILLSALQEGVMKAALAVVVVLAVQQAESGFVGPYFTASSTSVHPLAAFTGTLIMGSLFGLWGVLLAVPLLVAAQAVICACRKVHQTPTP